MDINAIYYVEVNLICIIIMVILHIYLSRNTEKYSSDNKVFSILLWSNIILCLSDLFIGIFLGEKYPIARFFVIFGNSLYYESMTVIAFLWLMYILIKFKRIKNVKRSFILWSIPLIILTVLVITNPFTKILFTVDSENIYYRNFGVIFHWIIVWYYWLIATVVVILTIIHNKNKVTRKKLANYFYFFIAPLIAGIIQMFFYGLTLSQVGITISILVFSLTEQSKMIFSDSLTGLNNRHSFNEYILNRIQHHSNSELTFLMIDINNFKHINDKYGHIAGDYALVMVSDKLKECIYSTHDRLFLCRYGGDEFLIVSHNSDLERMETLKAQINKSLSECDKNICSYNLKVSIGISHGIIRDYSDVEHLLHTADHAMYEEKAKNKIKA